MIYALVRRIPMAWRSTLAVISAVIVALVVIWVTVAIQHYPYDDGYDCHPPWWPSWIPL